MKSLFKKHYDRKHRTKVSALKAENKNLSLSQDKLQPKQQISSEDKMLQTEVYVESIVPFHDVNSEVDSSVEYVPSDVESSKDLSVQDEQNKPNKKLSLHKGRETATPDLEQRKKSNRNSDNSDFATATQESPETSLIIRVKSEEKESDAEKKEKYGKSHPGRRSQIDFVPELKEKQKRHSSFAGDNESDQNRLQLSETPSSGRKGYVDVPIKLNESRQRRSHYYNQNEENKAEPPEQVDKRISYTDEAAALQQPRQQRLPSFYGEYETVEYENEQNPVDLVAADPLYRRSYFDGGIYENMQFHSQQDFETFKHGQNRYSNLKPQAGANKGYVSSERSRSIQNEKTSGRGFTMPKKVRIWDGK